MPGSYRKLLVTGGSGFIGINLIERLLREKDLSIVNLDKLTYASNRNSTIDTRYNSHYFFEKVDLCDLEKLHQILELHKPDAVIHLAAESHVDRSIRAPEAFIKSNILGTYNLLQVCLSYWKKTLSGANSFRFLHASTDEVYGSLAEGAPSFSESAPYAPNSPYSASKASSDHLVRAWGNTYGFPAIIAHSCNNFGSYQHPEKFIPQIIQKCLRGEVIPVYGNGQNIRDWIYVEDHAEALCVLLDKGQVRESYNIGAENEIKNLDLVFTVCRIIQELKPFSKSCVPESTHNELSREIEGYEDLVSFVSDRPGHDFRYSINPSKINSELGWRAKHDFRSSLSKTIQWYMDKETSGLDYSTVEN
ncbi:MAG: dTDP-glucose 4,6-dehydratase [Verrucomicrobiota bacterium]